MPFLILLYNFNKVLSQSDHARGVMVAANNILIISHSRPDADTLGAALALRKWLKGEGKDITLACYDEVPDNLNFLAGVEFYQREFDIADYDLCIIVDCGADYMTGFHKEYGDFIGQASQVINIDHHASNDDFGHVNLVDVEAASTTLIIYRLFKDWGVKIDQEMATALLAGLYGDTGSFMHSNTSEEVLAVAGALVAAGAALREISNNLFNSKDVSTLRLWGKVLENAAVNEQGVVVSVVRDDDFAATESKTEDLSGVVDYLNMVPGSQFAILLTEDGQGNVKASFRTTQEDLDLSKLAANYGGGGHPKASGFTVPGRLEKHVSYSIVKDDQSEQVLEF